MGVEQYILDTLNNIGQINFDGVMKIVALLFVVFWIFVVIWVWNDAGERSRNLFFRLSSVLTVLVLNLFGLVIYLLIRPQFTIEEVYWSDLERRYLKYETKELGDCPKCGYQLQPGYIYCPECNYELKVKCKGCDLYFDKDNKYCPYCGILNKKEVQLASNGLEQISAEDMQEIASANKDEIVQTVEEKGTRYSSKKGVFFKTADTFKKLFRTKTPEEKAEEKRINAEKKLEAERVKAEKKLESEKIKNAKIEEARKLKQAKESKDNSKNPKNNLNKKKNSNKKVANKNNKKNNSK